MTAAAERGRSDKEIGMANRETFLLARKAAFIEPSGKKRCAGVNAYRVDCRRYLACQANEVECGHWWMGKLTSQVLWYGFKLKPRLAKRSHAITTDTPICRRPVAQA